MKLFRFIFVFMVLSSQVFAQTTDLAYAPATLPTEGFYTGDTLKNVSVDDLIAQVQPGTVLFVGEMHNLQPVRDQQMMILQALRQKGLKVSVGMEFFNYTDQALIQQYCQGQLTQDAFMTAVEWGGYDFNLYKDQLLFPQDQNGEFGLGINLDRSVTGIISKKGLAALTDEQKSLLPPNFTVGRDSYRERFFAAMGHHGPVSSMLENYFVAQSAWDDTMAWQSVEFMRAHPDHVFVIVVGEFHVQYGGGTPDRFKARLQAEGLQHNIVTVSQVYTQGLTDAEIQAELKPSPTEGPRADFIWLSK